MILATCKRIGLCGIDGREKFCRFYRSPVDWLIQVLGDHQQRPREYDEYGEGTMEVMGDVRRVGCISESGGHFGLEEELHWLLIMCGGVLNFCTTEIMAVQNVVDIIDLGWCLQIKMDTFKFVLVGPCWLSYEGIVHELITSMPHDLWWIVSIGWPLVDYGWLWVVGCGYFGDVHPRFTRVSSKNWKLSKLFHAHHESKSPHTPYYVRCVSKWYSRELADRNVSTTGHWILPSVPLADTWNSRSVHSDFVPQSFSFSLVIHSHYEIFFYQSLAIVS